MRIVLNDVTKEFAGRGSKQGKTVKAVDHFSAEIPDGVLVALLGPSGCGKSTTLNIICGLETPTSGTVFFDDTDVTHMPVENRGVGMVLQHYALYPMMTAQNNILFPLENQKGKNKLTKPEMLDRVQTVAKLVQIEDLLDRKPKELSGGQQQRVAIARALVKMPKVLLLDEPLSNLDARLRIQTREEIRRIQRETGITTIFVTHDQDEAMSISDFIIVMDHGVIQQIGEPQEVYDKPENLFVAKFLGTPQINIFNGVIREKKLWIGSDPVMDVEGMDEGKEVFVAIRPEGLVPNPDGTFKCSVQSVEVLGRDISVVFQHEESTEPKLRAIVSSEFGLERMTQEMSFSILPSKIHLFDKETQKRIAWESIQ